MKTFLFYPSRPGGPLFWPQRVCTSDLCARATAVLLFRKWFGLEPTRSWQWKGNMGQASDRRGNKVWVDQVQNDPVILSVAKYDPAFAAEQAQQTEAAR